MLTASVKRVGLRTEAVTLLRRFAQFDLANPKVWNLFQHFAFEMIHRGMRHYSADAVLHRVRWETDVPTNNDDGFKISNDFSCCYARKFRDYHPNHTGFFRLRYSQVDAEWNAIRKPLK
jgi:hypothetical protein